MADSRIRLTIESLFKGEGFTKANAAVGGLTKNIGQVGGSLEKLSMVVGGLGGTIGKIGSGLSGLFGSMAGGPLGIAVAGLTVVVSLFAKWRQSVEDTEKAQRETLEKMENGYKKRLYDAIERARKKQLELFDDIISKGDKAIKTMERLAGHLNTLNNANAGRQKAEFDARRAQVDAKLADDIINKRGDKLVLEANAAVEKTKIDNEQRAYEAKVEVANAANARGAAQKALEETKKQVKARQDRLKYFTDQLEKEKTRLANANFINNSNGGEETRALGNILGTGQAVPQDVGRIKANIKKLEDQLKDELKKVDPEAEKNAQQKLAEAEAQLSAAKARQKTVELQNETAAKQARRKLDEIQESADEEARKKRAEERRKEQEQIKNEQIGAQRDELERNKKNAQQAGKDRLEAAEKASKEEQKRQQRGMASDRRHHDGLFGAYEYQLDENGGIKNFRDWQRAGRYAERADRDARRNDPAERKFAQLERKDMAGKQLTERERAFMEDYRRFQEARMAPLTIKKLTKTIQEKVDAIDKKLKDLGAK